MAEGIEIGEFSDAGSFADWLAGGGDVDMDLFKQTLDEVKADIGIEIDYDVEVKSIGEGRSGIFIDGERLTPERAQAASDALLSGDVGKYYENLLGKDAFDKVVADNPQALDEMNKTSLALKADAGMIPDQMRILAPKMPGIEATAEALKSATETEIGKRMVEADSQADAVKKAAEVQDTPEAKAVADKITEDPNLKKILDKLEEAQKSGKGVELGEWAKTLVEGALGLLKYIGLALLVLYIVKQHQNSINGCWFVKKDGTREKISDYTCDKDQKKNASASSASIPGASCKGGCTGGNCSDCCSCAGNNSAACKGGGGQFSCVNKDMIGAVSDLAGAVIGAGGDLLKKILGYLLMALKYLAIGALIILGIIIIFYVAKILIRTILNRKKKKGEGGPKAQSPTGSRGSVSRGSVPQGSGRLSSSFKWRRPRAKR